MTTVHQDAILKYIRQLAAGRDLHECSDQELLEDFLARRKESAFTALVGRHGQMVLRVCRRVLRHEHDAEDAFQATFLVLARDSRSIRKRTSLADWLHGVAYRISMKAKRTAARHRIRENRLPGRLGPASGPSWTEVQVALDEELRKLAAPFRQAFVLCVLEEKSEKEAADLLAIKEGTVSSRVARARQQLRRQLSRRGINLSALLAGLAVAEGPAQAITGALARSTVSYGLLAAAGATAAVQIPGRITALAQGVSGAVLCTKIKLGTLVLLVTGILAAGLGAVAQKAPVTTDPPVASPRADRTHQKPKAAAPIKPPAPEATESITYSGHVFDPNKNPVAGAQVYYHFITREEEPIPVRARTDEQGRFSFTLTTHDVPRSADGTLSKALKAGQIVVKADGFAFAWHGVAKKTGNLTFETTRDDMPIQGRILDLQGKPLPGLKITVLSMSAPEKGDLTPFLRALRPRESFYAVWEKYLPNIFCNFLICRPGRIPILPSASTGQDGRFRLAGFGREQLIELRIEGPAIETQDVFILNRPRPANAEALLVRPRFSVQGYYARSEQAFFRWNNFEHAAAPGQTVVGLVRDAITKAPIPAALVETYSLAGTDLGENPVYHTIADAHGRYRLTGLPRGKGNRIRIRPPKDLAYMPLLKDVPALDPFQEATVDADLAPGVFVTVTARDKRTGNPVAGDVSYLVFPENWDPAHPFRGPFEDFYNTFMPIPNDGNFRFVAAPRKAIVAFRADGEGYPIAREAPTIRIPGGLPPSNWQAFATIYPKKGDNGVNVDFVLDAGGVVKGRIVGPDGQIASGTLTAGLRHDWYVDVDWSPLSKKGEFMATGLDPRRPRLVCFAHWEKKLAGSVVLRGDETEQVTVRLQPSARVRGRLLDAEGKPIKNATLAFTEVPRGKEGQPRALDVGLHVVAHIAGGRPSADPQTDKNGRFNIELLVPGLKYNLALYDANGATELEQIKWQGLVFTNLVLQPGEVRNLGDVRLQPFPKE